MSQRRDKKKAFECADGPASQTEQAKAIRHSNYEILPAPKVTSDGKYRCPKCGKIFEDLDSYNLHRHESKAKTTVERIDEPLM